MLNEGGAAEIDSQAIVRAALSLVEEGSSKAKGVEIAIESYAKSLSDRATFPISELQNLDLLIQLHQDIRSLLLFLLEMEYPQIEPRLSVQQSALSSLKLQRSKDALLSANLNKEVLQLKKNLDSDDRAGVDLF